MGIEFTQTSVGTFGATGANNTYMLLGNGNGTATPANTKFVVKYLSFSIITVGDTLQNVFGYSASSMGGANQQYIFGDNATYGAGEVAVFINDNTHSDDPLNFPINQVILDQPYLFIGCLIAGGAAPVTFEMVVSYEQILGTNLLSDNFGTAYEIQTNPGPGLQTFNKALLTPEIGFGPYIINSINCVQLNGDGGNDTSIQFYLQAGTAPFARVNITPPLSFDVYNGFSLTLPIYMQGSTNGRLIGCRIVNLGIGVPYQLYFYLSYTQDGTA